MDKHSLPPLPSVEELFAPSSSRSSSLPFLKNVNLFIPVPPLPPPSSADVPPVPPKSPTQEYGDPYSPVPPQPTSPLVDRFDYQLGDNKASDSLFGLEQKKRNEVISAREFLSGPPCKKARYSETDAAASSLQCDSREEGEISDEADDADQNVISGKTTAVRHKPLSPHRTVSRSEHVLHSSGHRRVPSDCPQNFPRTSPLPSHHHQSNSADIMWRSSHHRHRAHPSSSSSKDASKSEGGHHKKVHGASVHRNERSSSSHKQPAIHSDGRKVLDCSKDTSKSSSHRRMSSDRLSGTESAKHDLKPSSRNDGHKGSGYNHRRQSNSDAAVTETTEHELHSSRHYRSSDFSLNKGSGKDGSGMSDRQASLTDEPETTKKDASETASHHRPSSSADKVHRGGLSSSSSRSLRLQHIPAGSTLASEIAKNMSRSSVGQQASAGTFLAKNALQSLSLQCQSTGGIAADQTIPQLTDLSNQQQSLNSVKASYSGTESQYFSSHQSDALKHIKTSKHLRHQQSVMHECALVETTEKPSCQPEKHERFGNSAGNCPTPNDKSVNAGHLSKSYNDGLQSLQLSASRIPQPAVSTVPAATQRSSTDLLMLCSQKDLDAPYSPGSLDFDLFESTIASDLREGISDDVSTSSNIDKVSVACQDLESSAGQNSEITRTNVKDSVMEIDASDLVDELPAAEEVEESAAVEGRGQEYEIIDDLDSNADEANDDAVASSENSEVEFDSAEEENSPYKQVKAQHSQKVQTTREASEETQDNLEPFDEEDREGDDDFQAPLVNNKVVLHGESKKWYLEFLIC